MIFTIVVIASYLPWFLGLVTATCFIFVADYAGRVIYRASIDALEIRARYLAQEYDRERQRLALPGVIE